mmetsp:Transcript_31913/g.42138  ORF Transcript_31913/g.42138 Transcript_31913/m.42138 type:complete len:141 (-) Transcript_31913:213-635(-)|eukprot:CAMPEP_0117746708 /NCGR_PEP_ID=MMETSP0947-20121206/8100_1 /TAXON_ID=44440 /ORGANISM="Chattonella subsalsa, Strain CCMP2191" /LENGTH=140 /DNA_ID=CAMNT_0005564069 /DNA_START=174 /DNA_END=596 /DNA_ORIENTATION=-
MKTDTFQSNEAATFYSKLPDMFRYLHSNNQSSIQKLMEIYQETPPICFKKEEKGLSAQMEDKMPGRSLKRPTLIDEETDEGGDDSSSSSHKRPPQLNRGDSISGTNTLGGAVKGTSSSLKMAKLGLQKRRKQYDSKTFRR